MAFSQEENALIRQSLLAEGRRRAVTVGMRKTSVEQLTEAAGISKGSFYKYFESKEMLFLAALEDIHTEVYQVARDTLEAGRDLPPEDCAAETLLAACRDYFAKTGRRISFEYTMIDGVSDSPEQAELLAKKLAGMGAHVNMIPLNNVTESGLHTASPQAIRRFQTILESHGITATLRRTLGSDIDASCGQLRRKYEST